jgi:hypothetical protein
MIPHPCVSNSRCRLKGDGRDWKRSFM